MRLFLKRISLQEKDFIWSVCQTASEHEIGVALEMLDIIEGGAVTELDDRPFSR